MDPITLLSQVVAVAYVAFGVLGLLVVSVPGNCQQMFLGDGPRWLGPARIVHAYLTLFILVACGVAVWFWPLAVEPLALAVLVLVLVGKVPNIALGQWQSCKFCVVVGPALALITTAVLVASRPSPVAQWAVGAPTAVAGLCLSFRWQVRADSGS